MKNVLSFEPAIAVDKYIIYTRSVIKAAQVAADLNENGTNGTEGERLGVFWEFISKGTNLPAIRARKGNYPIETECDLCYAPILTSDSQLQRAESERKIIVCSKCWEQQ